MNGPHRQHPVWTSEVECLDDLRALYQETSIEVIPTWKSRLRGRLYGTRFGESALTIARFDGSLRTRGVQSGEVSIGLQMGVLGRASQWSLDLEPGDIVVLPPGSERDGSLIGQATFATVTMNIDTFNRLVRPSLPEAGVISDDRPRRYRSPPAVRNLIRREVALLITKARNGYLGPHVGTRVFEREMMLPFLVGIANDVSETDRQSARVDASLVRRVEDWAETADSNRVNVLDICAALGVPLRTLQRSFSSSLGTGPASYLRFRRLARARNSLSALGPSDTSVTDVAMEHGFWDLSRFAVQYKKVYGESPSETLKASPGRRPLVGNLRL